MPPLLQIVLFIFFWIFAFWGFGSFLTQRLLPGHPLSASSNFAGVLIGFSLFVFYALVLNFFTPLTAWVIFPYPLLGLILGITRLSRVQVDRRSLPSLAGWAAVLLGVSIAAAALGMAEPYNYDSGLYHFTAIRWANQASAMPGIGLLHDRLAFNNSFFVYAAALNLSPFFNQARSLANNILFMTAFAFTSWKAISTGAGAFSVNKKAAFTLDLVVYLPLLAALLHLFATSDGFSSPTPDLASTVLQICLFVLIYEWGKSQREAAIRQALASAILLLAITMLTIKLSNAVFAGLAALWVIYTELRIGSSRKWLRIVIMIAAVFGLAWVWRGYLSSGTPLFPSTLGYIGFPWAIPKAEIKVSADWVKHWAQAPGTSLFEAHADWAWFKPWLQRQVQNLTAFTYPLLLSLGLAVLAAVTRRKQKTRSLLEAPGLFLSVITLAALVFWFIAAPDLRFANGYIYILPMSLALLCLEGKKPWKMPRQEFWAALLLVAILSVNYIGYSLLYFKDLSFSPNGFAPIPAAELREEVTHSGLIVHVPASGDRCWDSPLPCTPVLRPELQLLGPDEEGRGFRLLD